MDLKRKLLGLCKKYGSAAKFVATTILGLVPGGPALTPLVEKVFDTAQQAAQDEWEQNLAKLTAENVARLDGILDILSGDFQHVMEQLARLQEVPEQAVRQLKILRENDERCRAGFGKLDTIMERFDRLEQQSNQVLAGQQRANEQSNQVLARQERANEMHEESLTILRDISSTSSKEALQNYLDQMSGLISNRGLRDVRPGAPGANVMEEAQRMTESVLASGRLDGALKGKLVKRLFQWGLLQNGDQRIIKLKGLDLSCADLHCADLRAKERGVVNGISLRGAHLQTANLFKANLSGAYLREAILAGADLRWANLNAANLQKADMTNALLEGAKLGSANLSMAKLCNANLQGTVFGSNSDPKKRTDFSQAELAGADLSGTDLRFVSNLTQDQLESARGDATVKLRRGLVLPASWSAVKG
jgi:uncharacterized protein YjbI with pentapeptide repeats